MSAWSPKPASGLPEGLILFDGVCLFCSRWVRWVIERDRAARFRFMPVQSPSGSAIARSLGVDPGAPETNVLVIGGHALFKSDAVLAVLGSLPGWGWASALRAAPRRVRDPAYDLIANNRYRLFGRSDVCFAPTPQERARFLDGDFHRQ